MDPPGHNPISNLIKLLNDEGFVTQVGVTSLNSDQETEISRSERAIELCREKGLTILLQDPSHVRLDEVQGSFAVWDIQLNRMIRDGHVPVSIIEHIIGLSINTKGMKPAQYPQIEAELFELITQGYSLEYLRSEVLKILHAQTGHAAFPLAA